MLLRIISIVFPIFIIVMIGFAYGASTGPTCRWPTASISRCFCQRCFSSPWRWRCACNRSPGPWSDQLTNCC